EPTDAAKRRHEYVVKDHPGARRIGNESPDEAGENVTVDHHENLQRNVSTIVARMLDRFLLAFSIDEWRTLRRQHDRILDLRGAVLHLNNCMVPLFRPSTAT